MEKNRFQVEESNSQKEAIARSRIYCQNVHFDDVFESSQETNVVNNSDQNVEAQYDSPLKAITNNSGSHLRKTNSSQKSTTTPKKSYTPTKKSNNNNNNITPRKTSTPKKKNTPRKSLLSTFKPALVPSHLKTYLASEDEHIQPGPYQQFRINTPKKLPQTEIINISSSTSSPNVSDQVGHSNSKKIKIPNKNNSYSIPRDPPPIINISSTTTSSSSSSPSSPSPPRAQKHKVQSHSVSGAKSKSKTFGFNTTSDSDTGNLTSINKTAKNAINPKCTTGVKDVLQPVVVVPSVSKNNKNNNNNNYYHSQTYLETKKTLDDPDSESEKFKILKESQSKNYDRMLALSASFSQSCSIPDILPLETDSQIKESNTKNEPMSSSLCDPSPHMFFSMPAKLTNDLNESSSDIESMGSAETQYPEINVPEALDCNNQRNDNNANNISDHDIPQDMECDDGEKTSPDLPFGCGPTTIFVMNSQDKTTKQALITDHFKIKKQLKKKRKKVKKLKKELQKLKQELASHERATNYSRMLKTPLMKELMKGFDHEEHFRNQEQKRTERRLMTAVICPKGECACFCPPNWIGCECLCFCS